MSSRTPTPEDFEYGRKKSGRFAEPNRGESRQSAQPPTPISPRNSSAGLVGLMLSLLFNIGLILYSFSTKQTLEAERLHRSEAEIRGAKLQIAIKNLCAENTSLHSRLSETPNRPWPACSPEGAQGTEKHNARE